MFAFVKTLFFLSRVPLASAVVFRGNGKNVDEKTDAAHKLLFNGDKGYTGELRTLLGNSYLGARFLDLGHIDANGKPVYLADIRLDKEYEKEDPTECLLEEFSIDCSPRNVCKLKFLHNNPKDGYCFAMRLQEKNSKVTEWTLDIEKKQLRLEVSKKVVFMNIPATYELNPNKSEVREYITGNGKIHERLSKAPKKHPNYKNEKLMKKFNHFKFED